MTPVCGSAWMDRNDASVVVSSTTTRSVAGIDDVTVHAASTTAASLWAVTTATTSCGSSGQGEDVSDAMKVVGGAEICRMASVAVVRSSGGEVSV